MPPLSSRDVTEEIMKRYTCVAGAVLLLASGSVLAEQSASTTMLPSRETLIAPAPHNESQWDLNHMGAGSDKSDELGVPYYNSRQ